jgi:hypothetical protein
LALRGDEAEDLASVQRLTTKDTGTVVSAACLA